MLTRSLASKLAYGTHQDQQNRMHRDTPSDSLHSRIYLSYSLSIWKELHLKPVML